MTAPDRGLTDLLAAHRLIAGDCTGCDWRGSTGMPGDQVEHTAHVALVVEQHTQGQTARVAELEATVARVEAIVPRVIQGLGRKATFIDVGYASGQKKVWADITAALEGEQR